MLQDIVSVGDKIELYKHSNREKQPWNSRRYLSRLLDFKGPNEVCIAMPIENGRIIPFNIGDKYRICYYTKFGLYQCLCEINDRYKINNIYIAVAEMKSELEKFQRRQYYRLNYLQEIRYSLLNESYEQEEKPKITMQNQTFETATMIDISGGGCKFNCNELIPKETTLILSFYLELSKGITQFELLGKVVYSSEIQNRKMYEHRIEFMDIKETERENIVRFIFDEERRRRRKEMV